MEDCTSRRCFPLLQFFVTLCPGAGRLACELYILLSCLLPILMGGEMLTGMIRVVLAAKHVIHPGRILYVALGVVVMMTFYASTIFGSFAFFADLSAYVSPQRITTTPLSMAAASLGIKLRHCLKAVLIRRCPCIAKAENCWCCNQETCLCILTEDVSSFLPGKGSRFSAFVIQPMPLAARTTYTVMLPAQQGFVDKLAAEEKEKIFCGAKNAILPAGNVI